MMKMRFAGCVYALFALCFACQVSAKTDTQFLPSDTSYDESVPTPESVLGAPVGEWHVRHDQLVSYMRALASSSPRVTLIETGKTHENRPLLLLAFTHQDNQASLENMRKRHLSVIEQGRAVEASDPLVIWMGYSVHGDEASGSNAALLIAYYLAAGNDDEVNRLLADNIVLLDPSLNPDGLSRFAQWANMHRGMTLVDDPDHREHKQDWPSGRTNHYWFDLNRDWLLQVHPESRARVKQFHRWRPHVLTDFHEMGSNSTYFFQPGIPSRKNPWTPQKNVELTQALAQYHGRALDERGQLYFTQEAFDDFYYGKGSTYPDALGTVGILFEQASARGHVQQTINGRLSFPDAIQNQVTTSLSTFRGALAHKKALLEYQQAFNGETNALSKKDDVKGYLVTESRDRSKFARFQALLRYHNIRYQQLSGEIKTDAGRYDPTQTIFVPVQQPQYRLIKSLFSERQRFDDNTFYDVSNWNLALAFNLKYEPVYRDVYRRLDPVEFEVTSRQPASENTLPAAYAYAFEWHDSQAPALLQTLLQHGIRARLAGAPFSAQTTQGQVSFDAGTVVIADGSQQNPNYQQVLATAANQNRIKVWAVTSGLTAQGIDLGSRHMRPVRLPKVLLVGGRGTSQYEVGEAWHYLDREVGMPVSIVELEKLSSVDLDKYSHLVFVDGQYGGVKDSLEQAIGQWVQSGGVLIGQKNAAKWFSSNKWLAADFLEDRAIDDLFTTDGLSFADKDALEAKQRIAGAAFSTTLDTSHPLSFGYTRSELPVFRNSDLVMTRPDKPFITASKYTAQPLIAGYTADELQRVIANSAAVVAHRKGRGRVIGFTDNLNFRGYWAGTSRLLSNAIFMAGFIDAEG